MSDALEIFHGADVPVSLEFLQQLSGSPVDLTNLSIYLRAKRHSHDPDSKLVIDIEQSVHLDADSGQSVITIPEAIVNALAFDHEYHCWIQLEGSGTIGTFSMVKRPAPDIPP